MSHYSRLSKIVIDVPPAGHGRELAFWSAAAGQPLTQSDRYPEYHGAALGDQEPGLLIQRLADGPARVHIDIHTDDLAAEVARSSNSAPDGSSGCPPGGFCAIRPGCCSASSPGRPARPATATRTAGSDAAR